jgi:N-hydroxyarylamine O-acetyltransferase
LKAALEALGAEVETLLGRVRVGAPPGSVRPRSHLVLRIRLGGQTWHADVGFGRGTLLESRFGLAGFALDPGDRVVPTAAAHESPAAAHR